MIAQAASQIFIALLVDVADSIADENCQRVTHIVPSGAFVTKGRGAAGAVAMRRMDRAFSPRIVLGGLTQADGLGWYDGAPLALVRAAYELGPGLRGET